MHLVAFDRSPSHPCNLLILRATNLCRQGVTGSIPVTSTNQFSNLAAWPESVAETWCTFLVHTHSKSRRYNRIKGRPLGFCADSAVMFQHPAAHMPGYRHDGHIACLRLGELRDAGYSKIVKTAVKPCAFQSMTPRRAPSLCWSRRVKTCVLAPWENILVRLGAGKPLGPAATIRVQLR